MPNLHNRPSDTNFIEISGLIMSPLTRHEASETDPLYGEMTIRITHNYYDAKKTARRLYYRIPILVEDTSMIDGIARTIGEATDKVRCLVNGRLVRRKRARPDGTTYMTTCVLATRMDLMATLPSRSTQEGEGVTTDAQ